MVALPALISELINVTHSTHLKTAELCKIQVSFAVMSSHIVSAGSNVLRGFINTVA